MGQNSQDFDLYVGPGPKYEDVVDFGTFSTFDIEGEREGRRPGVNVSTEVRTNRDGQTSVQQSVEVDFGVGKVAVDPTGPISGSLNRGPLEVGATTEGDVFVKAGVPTAPGQVNGVYGEVDLPAIGRNIGVFGDFAARVFGGLSAVIDRDVRGATNPIPLRCFSGDAQIRMADGSLREIRDVRAGDLAAAFDPQRAAGRGELDGREVVRLYRNVTQEFIKLDFADGRTSIHVTPGHAVLDETGSFTKIGDLMRLGGGVVRLIDETGEVVVVSGESVRFSAETADLFERSSVRSVGLVGGAALEAEVEEGWATYNFEVADHHTYVAGGVRVHNDSGVLGQVGDDLDNGFFDRLGRAGDAVGDVVNGAFHAAGQFVGGVRRAGEALSDGFSRAGERFSDGDVIGGIAEVGRGIGEAIGEVARGIGNAIAEVGRGISNAVSSVFGGRDDNDNQGSDRGKPIVIDMDRDGVELEDVGDVTFDMDGDGFKERTSWVDVDDAFLVIDLNADGSRGRGDGKIDQTAELALASWVGWDGATDLQALATFDSVAERGGNGDGRLTAADSVWSELRIWRDADRDGVADAGELKTLSQLGFTEIGLAYADGTEFGDLSNDVTIFGNTLLGVADYVRNGQTFAGVGDVALIYDAEGARITSTAYGRRVAEEGGGGRTIAETKGRGANVDLTSDGRDGAVGDGRANLLNATNSAKPVHLEGRAGADRLIGGAKDDQIEGGAGADRIDGGGGRDTAFYVNSNAGVFVHLLSGEMRGGHAEGDSLTSIENVVGSRFDDTINGNAVGNQIRAGAGDDKVYSLGGWDRVWLGDGDDTATGGGGNDRLFGEAGRDNLWGGDRDDRLYGNAGHDRLFGQDGADQLYGGAGHDLLRGGSKDDVIHGGNGDDRLYGDVGGDRIIGGQGDDTMTGGTHGVSTDVFVFRELAGSDRITDFELAEDRLEFRGKQWRDLDITDTADGARISYGGGDEVLLEDVRASQLNQSHFDFV